MFLIAVYIAAYGRWRRLDIIAQQIVECLWNVDFRHLPPTIAVTRRRQSAGVRNLPLCISAIEACLFHASIPFRQIGKLHSNVNDVMCLYLVLFSQHPNSTFMRRKFCGSHSKILGSKDTGGALFPYRRPNIENSHVSIPLRRSEAILARHIANIFRQFRNTIVPVIAATCCFVCLKRCATS